MPKIRTMVAAIAIFVGCAPHMEAFAANPGPLVTIAPHSLVAWRVWKDNVILCFNDGAISVWSLTADKEISQFPVRLTSNPNADLFCKDNLDYLWVREQPELGGPLPLVRFDLPSGTRGQPFPLPQGWHVVGVDATGKQFLAYEWDDLKSACFDLQSGQKKWGIYYSDLVKAKSAIWNMPTGYFQGDGAGVIQEFGDRIIARDDKNKEVWQKHPKAGERWLSVVPSCVLGRTLVMSEPDSSALMGVSTSDGSDLWKLVPPKGSEFRAYDDNANVVAIFDGSALDFYSPGPPLRVVKVQAKVSRWSETRFTGDGKELVVVPGVLDDSREKPATATERAERDGSRIDPKVVLVDVATGATIRTLNIKHSSASQSK